MELDTGAAVSLISISTRDQLFSDVPLHSTSTVLTTYTGQRIAVAGMMEVGMRYGGKLYSLQLHVVREDGPNLLGRDWLRVMRLDWGSLKLSMVANSNNRKLDSLLEIDQYPLPKPDDLFASLAGGKQFSKIDLTSAYQQMSIDQHSKELVVINTHKGLYRYTRLPFGVASASAIFHKAMDTVLQGLPNVICYLDDILITGRNEEEHLGNVECVLERLHKYNIYF